MLDNKDLYQRRISALQKRLSEKNLDCLLVTKVENQVYLSGFRSTNCYLIISADQAWLLTDFRYIESAKRCEELYEIVRIGQRDSLAGFFKEKDFRKIGVEEQALTAERYRQLQVEMGQEVSLIFAGGLVERVRAIKDEFEMERIKQAAALTDFCFSHIVEFIQPGMTELEIALEMELFLRKNGAERLSFDTICVSGEKSSLPHGMPGDKQVAKGEFLTMDFGCVVDGYCSDMTRTVAIGTPSQEQQEIYELVLKAQLAGIEAIRAGAAAREVDSVSRKIISDAGYGEYFGHGLGHGVGLEIHEAPTLNPGSEEILEENMTVTIEPGIYLPQKFGVRIEDLAFVTASGIINAVHSPKELIVI